MRFSKKRLGKDFSCPSKMNVVQLFILQKEIMLLKRVNENVR